MPNEQTRQAPEGRRNVPAVRQTQQVAVRRPDPVWPANVAEAMELGAIACQMLGKEEKEQGTMAAVILQGLELGIAPMTAARGIWIVKGAPYISANLQRAIVLASPVCRSLTVKPVLIPVVDQDGKKTGAMEPGAQARGARADNGDAMTVTVRISQFEHLIKRDSAWEKTPGDMLVARASSKLCRGLFADVLFGMGVAEVRQQEGGEEVIQVEPIDAESDDGAFVGAERVDPDSDQDREWEEAQRKAVEQEQRANAEGPSHDGDREGQQAANQPAGSGKPARPWGLTEPNDEA